MLRLLAAGESTGLPVYGKCIDSSDALVRHAEATLDGARRDGRVGGGLRRVDVSRLVTSTVGSGRERVDRHCAGVAVDRDGRAVADDVGRSHH